MKINEESEKIDKAMLEGFTLSKMIYTKCF